MEKLFKTILISSLALLGAATLSVQTSFADIDLISVQFEKTPLFSEANFLPGDSVSRFAKVINNTSEAQQIVARVDNVTDPDNLASRFDLTIKQGATTLYGGTLASFFAAGNVNLSNLAGGAGNQNQYDFTLEFNPLSGNDYQNKLLGFDLSIGVMGEEMHTDNPIKTTGGGGDSGGGGLIILSISNEQNRGPVSVTSYRISWFTNIPATTRVIYDTVPHLSLGAAPNFGYPYSSIEDPTMTTYHELVITGLIPGLTYYWKPVSGNPTTLGLESSFTMSFVAGQSTSTGQDGNEGNNNENNNGGFNNFPGGGPGNGTGTEPGNEEDEDDDDDDDQGIYISGFSNVNGFGFNPAYFLASIGSFFKDLFGMRCTEAGDCCCRLFWIFIILTLIYLFFRERKRKKLENLPIKKIYKDLIISLAIIILLIIWLRCWWLIIPAIMLIFWMTREKLILKLPK